MGSGASPKWTRRQNMPHPRHATVCIAYLASTRSGKVRVVHMPTGDWRHPDQRKVRRTAEQQNSRTPEHQKIRTHAKPVCHTQLAIFDYEECGSFGIDWHEAVFFSFRCPFPFPLVYFCSYLGQWSCRTSSSIPSGLILLVPTTTTMIRSWGSDRGPRRGGSRRPAIGG
jgi:hypothetical protein